MGISLHYTRWCGQSAPPLLFRCLVLSSVVSGESGIISDQSFLIANLETVINCLFIGCDGEMVMNETGFGLRIA